MAFPFWLSLISWAALLWFLEFAMAGIEKFSFPYSLPWGPLIFRLGFVTTGVVLLLRLLSLRSQKNWEKMAAGIRQTIGIPLDDRPFTRSGWANLVLDLSLIIINLTAIPAGLNPTQHPWAWKAAMGCDGISFLLVWFWTSKVSWLRSLRRRERIKAFLDDLHSRMVRTPPAPTLQHDAGLRIRLAFTGVRILAAAGLISITWMRFHSAAGIEAKTAVAACMESAWGNAKSSTNLSDQTLANLPNPLPCLPGGKDFYQSDWKLEAGGLRLRVWEEAYADPFHDGIKGDQGFTIDPEGKLVELERQNF